MEEWQRAGSRVGKTGDREQIDRNTGYYKMKGPLSETLSFASIPGSGMTPEEIDKLEAGRYTDILVAQGMGWSVIETDDCNGEDNYWLSKDGQHPFEDQYGNALMLPLYSKDISPALEVVEKMKDICEKQSKGFRMEWTDGGWSAGFINDIDDADCHDFHFDYEIGSAHTLPLAISRAFLKAKLKES